LLLLPLFALFAPLLDALALAADAPAALLCAVDVDAGAAADDEDIVPFAQRVTFSFIETKTQSN
jgi:hypothetical protein